MAAYRSRAGFSQKMKSEELLEWLRVLGLRNVDLEKIQEEEFNGESFLLLDGGTLKEMGIKMSGQIMIKKLLNEAKPSSEDVILQNPTSAPPTSQKAAKVMPFCSKPPLGYKPAQDGVARREGAAGAYVAKSKIWKDRQQLSVYFLNDEFIDAWKCRSESMTVETIMAWAKVWNSPGYDNIPELVMKERNSRERTADIRVKFSNDEGCWSMVGMEARTVEDFQEPTMVLSLRGHPQSAQRSLVIHEFGHALGLEHEHQRSDFWKVVGEYFDKDKMMEDPRVAKGSVSEAKASFERDWFAMKPNPEGALQSEYDPESIMHYTFDVHWLKGDLKYQDNIDSVGGLSDKARKYLHAIHEQSAKNYQLAKNPSQEDLQVLDKAYGIQGSGVRATAKSVRTMIVMHPSEILALNNFRQQLIDGDWWYSPPVYTHQQGYKICLGVCVSGHGNNTHVSAFVYFMRGEFDNSLTWPFRGAIQFQLLDQTGNNHKTHLCTYDDSVEMKNCERVRYGERANSGWGAPMLIAHSSLKPRFLHRDRLLFQIVGGEAHI